MSMAHLEVRPAAPDDYNFALTLYLESVKPLLVALNKWEEERVLSRFAQGFKLEEINVLRWAGADAGWMQVSETDQEFHLDQLHLIGEVRNQHIGTYLIRALQDRARAANKSLGLNVIRGNRAKMLYERLGFCSAGGDDEKLRMVWHPEGADAV